MVVRRKRPSNPEVQQVKRVNAVLCSDIHYRATVPMCRKEGQGYLEVQEDKLNFVFNLCRQYGVSLLHGGDLGDKSQWPNWLLERFLMLSDGVRIFSALGQHDLPAHSLENFHQSGCGVLYRAGRVEFFEEDVCCGERLNYSHWGQAVPKQSGILLTHRMVINGKEDWEGQQADQASRLLLENPGYRLILSGDNHKPFVCQFEDRLLVNPGSLMRMKSDQWNHRPRVYLWDADANEVSPVYIPIEPPEAVIDRTHIEVAEERDERLKALIDRVRLDYDVGLSFEKNVEEHFAVNEIRPGVRAKILNAMEGKANGNATR